ncbi:MAG: hypothetical protein V1870_00155 [Candidatus Aenigmatarchaeota archaeon]
MVKNKDVTVLAVGDKKDWDSYIKLDENKNRFIGQGFDYKTTNYTRVLKGNVVKIHTKKIIILLFFPFQYWNKHIEHKKYKGIYGNKIFYRKFRVFWKTLYKKLSENYPNKEIIYVNHPFLCAAYRLNFATSNN